MKRLTLSIILVFLASLYPVNQAFAVMGGHTQSGDKFQDAGLFLEMQEEGHLLSETAKIISVLKDRIEDPAILARTSDKLLTLDFEEIMLVSSLCDRIGNGQRTAQAEIAFSLVTALIVLS